MIRWLAPLTALILCLLLAAAAAARDIYVSNIAGDDRFTGQSPEGRDDGSGPVHSIGRALRLAAPGDRIVLAKTDVPYRESISLVGSRHSGYPNAALTIEGHGAVLDGSAPVSPEAWKHFAGAIFRFEPPQKGFQQLFLDGKPAQRVPVSHLSDSPPKLDPLQWALQGGYIYFCVEPTKLPADYAISVAQRATGITLYHVERVAISDLVVQGFQIDGINAFNTARNVYLAGVTARGNGRSGVTVGGASVVEIDACLLGNNGQAQLLTLPQSEVFVHNSRLLGNTAPGWVDQGGKVFSGGDRLEGGRDELLPTDEEEAEAKPAAKEDAAEPAKEEMAEPAKEPPAEKVEPVKPAKPAKPTEKTKPAEKAKPAKPDEDSIFGT
jgi:hypothetical protein